MFGSLAKPIVRLLHVVTCCGGRSAVGRARVRGSHYRSQDLCEGSAYRGVMEVLAMRDEKIGNTVGIVVLKGSAVCILRRS